jgi:hypothetical protein
MPARFIQQIENPENTWLSSEAAIDGCKNSPRILVSQVSESSRRIYFFRGINRAFVGEAVSKFGVGQCSWRLPLKNISQTSSLYSTKKAQFVDMEDISINSSQRNQYTVDKFLTIVSAAEHKKSPSGGSQLGE